jgi:hypothetical protein
MSLKLQCNLLQPAECNLHSKLPRHVLQFLYQEVGKYSDFRRKMFAAAVSDVDAGFRHTGPRWQQRNEIALLDAVVAKIARDQPDPTSTQGSFIDRLGIVRPEFAGNLDLVDPAVQLKTPDAAGRGIVAEAQTMVGREIRTTASYDSSMRSTKRSV